MDTLSRGWREVDKGKDKQYEKIERRCYMYEELTV